MNTCFVCHSKLIRQSRQFARCTNENCPDGTLFVLCGYKGGAPVSGGDSGQLCPAGGGCAGVDSAPLIGNFNNLGAGGPAGTRHLPGTTMESAFIFMLGGDDGTAGALDTVEFTIW